MGEHCVLRETGEKERDSEREGGEKERVGEGLD